MAGLARLARHMQDFDDIDFDRFVEKIQIHDRHYTSCSDARKTAFSSFVHSITRTKPALLFVWGFLDKMPIVKKLYHVCTHDA